LKKFKQSQPFKPWLYAIVRNSCLDYLKKKNPLPFSSLDSESIENLGFLNQVGGPAMASPETDAEKALLADKLSTAVKTLTPEYAEVISLRHELDLSFKEIAERSSEPLNTVKSRYRRALQQLRKLLTPFGF